MVVRERSGACQIKTTSKVSPRKSGMFLFSFSLSFIFSLSLSLSISISLAFSKVLFHVHIFFGLCLYFLILIWREDVVRPSLDLNMTWLFQHMNAKGKVREKGNREGLERLSWDLICC